MLKGLPEYHEATLGVIQLGLDAMASRYRGHSIGPDIICVKTARKGIYCDELEDLVDEALHFIFTQVIAFTPYTYLTFPFQYKVTANLNLFIGIDLRDMQ